MTQRSASENDGTVVESMQSSTTDTCGPTGNQSVAQRNDVNQRKEKETPWIDAWIRWEQNSKETINNNDENNDEDDADEEEEHDVPTRSFAFEYHHAPTDAIIHLQLQGFPSESEQIWNSTGLTLWPCSHFLCEYLCENMDKLLPSLADAGTSNNATRIITVVELGSGLGRCGLLLHGLLQSYNDATEDHDIDPLLANHHVYLTDGDTETLYQLRQNVSNNIEEEDTNCISCHQLLWGQESARQFCARHNLLQEANDSNVSESIDLVIASDVIYVYKVIEPLFKTVSVLLQQHIDGNNNQNDTGNTYSASAQQQEPTFLMAHSDRRVGSSVNLNMILDGAKAAGLDPSILQEHAEEGIYIISFTLLNRISW